MHVCRLYAICCRLTRTGMFLCTFTALACKLCICCWLNCDCERRLCAHVCKHVQHALYTLYYMMQSAKRSEWCTYSMYTAIILCSLLLRWGECTSIHFYTACDLLLREGTMIIWYRCTILHCAQCALFCTVYSLESPHGLLCLPAFQLLLMYIIHSFILKVYNLQTIKLMNYILLVLLLPFFFFASKMHPTHLSFHWHTAPAISITSIRVFQRFLRHFSASLLLLLTSF